MALIFLLVGGAHLYNTEIYIWDTVTEGYIRIKFNGNLPMEKTSQK